MPASFTFPDARTDAWIAAQSTRATASSLFTFIGVARLRDGTTLASARAEMTQLITDLSRVSPNHRGWIATALPLQDAVVGQIARTLWILLAAVGLVLLVACANVANLFLVRSDARRREVAVRQALGASSRALADYFLAESVLLSLAGSVTGLGLSWGAVQLLVAFAPVTLPRLEEVRLDAPVLAFTLALSLLTAIAFGAIPWLPAASASTCLPLSTYCLEQMVVPEGVVDDGTLRPRALFYAVAGGYFEATGIRLLRGRFIDSGDVERGAPIAVVNTALADALFPNHDPLGKRFRSSGPPTS